MGSVANVSPTSNLSLAAATLDNLSSGISSPLVSSILASQASSSQSPQDLAELSIEALALQQAQGLFGTTSELPGSASLLDPALLEGASAGQQTAYDQSSSLLSQIQVLYGTSPDTASNLSTINLLA